MSSSTTGPPPSPPLWASSPRRLLAICLAVLLCLCLCAPPPASALPDSINIGAIFTSKRLEQERAFQLAIKRLNADRVLLPRSRLVPSIEHVQEHDSFHADKKVCGLLLTGVAAIFDPLDGHISRHLQSICDALDIPHIESHWDFRAKRDDLSINLYPRPSVLAKAYVDIVRAWKWEQFVILYEDNEGLMRLQDFFKEAQARSWRIKLHQFTPGGPYRETFWKIKNDGEYNIILDVKSENIFRALKHAQQVGLITEAHSYLITQLDLHTIDLEDFKFGKTKISAFKLIEDTSQEFRQLVADWKREYPNEVPEAISTESALIYDAVTLLTMALKGLDASQTIEIQSVSCDTSKPWAHGSSLINYMRPVQFSGLTGLVRFDESGFRSSIRMSIVTVEPNGLQEIGTWSEDAASFEGRLNISVAWTDHYSTSALENKTLIITTILNKPYTMIKDSSFKRTGNDQFEGYAIDLVAELSKILHFKYEFHLVKDGAYGRPNKSGVWSGMMGELIRGEADLAVADLTITSKREEAVDFTHPFMNTGISILFKKPTKKVTSLFSFLSPFSKVVWICLMCSYVGISTMLFIVGRLSPYEWENPHPCRQNEQVLENSFSLSNSFWFTIGSLMQQASDLTPKAMSTRTIAGIWYFFTLIMIASYTANLAAFLTVEKIVYPIENSEGLSKQDKIKYGCLATGSTASFFSESNITTYKRMWEFMTKHPEVFKKTNEEGRISVEKADGAYAFLMESASIEYVIERNCNLTQIGGLLDSKGYGIATAKDSLYRMPLSQAILKLQESGELLILKERWWKQKKGGGKCIDDAKKGSGSVTPLKIDNVGGVFVVLLGGLSFSLFVAILEFVWKSRQDLKTESVCEEMISDLKFAFLCQSSSKVLRSKENKLAGSASLENSDELYLPSHHYIHHPNMSLGSAMPPQTVANLAETHSQHQHQHHQHHHQCSGGGGGHHLGSIESNVGTGSYPDFATLSSNYRTHSRSTGYGNNVPYGQSANKIRSSMHKFANKFIAQPSDSLPRAQSGGQHYSSRYRHQPECPHSEHATGHCSYHSLNKSSNSIAGGGGCGGGGTPSALRSSRGNNGTKHHQTRFALDATLIDGKAHHHHHHEHRHGRRGHNGRAQSNSCSNLVAGMPTTNNTNHSIPDLSGGVPSRPQHNSRQQQQQQHGRQSRFAHNQLCSRSFEDDTLVHLA